MFVLTGSLPTSRLEPTGIIPTSMRLWNTTFDSIQPTVGLDPYGNFLSLNFEPVEEGLGTPTYFGRIYKVITPFPIAEVDKAVSNSVSFNLIPDPSTISPASGYFTSRNIYLYANNQHPLTASTDIDITLWGITTLPLPSNGTHTLNLSSWGTFTASQIVINGYLIKLAANPGSPQPGEFVQSGSTLTITVGTLYNFPSFTQVLVNVIYETTVPAPSWSVATFDLTSTGIVLPDQIDYLGHALAPITDADELHDWGFFWNRPIATLILPVTTWIEQLPTTPASGAQVINSTLYTSDI
jgi:hypothetical protein